MCPSLRRAFIMGWGEGLAAGVKPPPWPISGLKEKKEIYTELRCSKTWSF